MAGLVRQVALVGPTASGKSALALELARCRPSVELVSVDSMCVYRGMDIGTAKPTAEARARVPHHLLDIADPAEEFTVRRFQAEAAAVLDDVETRGRRALLVGGTGLYLRAVVDRLAMPGRWPAVAAELDAEASTVDGLQRLYTRLATIDPTAARRVAPTNRRRVVRALEVTLGSGRPFSSFGPGLDAYPPSSFVMAGIRIDPAALDARIEARLQGQLAGGLLDEVRMLAGRPGGLSRTARQALGYRELLTHVEDGVGLEEAVQAALRRIRVFARRQWAWFRRDPRIDWLDTSGDVRRQLLAIWDKAAAPAIGGPGDWRTPW